MNETHAEPGPEEDDEPEPDLSGTELDRYRLVRRVGQGGMGAVYEAKHTVLGTSVAVKLLRPELAINKRARRRFLREAKVAARVKHPNIVELTDFGEQPEIGAFFVMEYLEGHDLGAELKRNGPMSWERARPIVLQIVSALEASHEQGVLHRDVKPSNCFLVDRGPGSDTLVKVLDFGIARLSSLEEDTEPITNTGQVLGTVGYMAPEVFKGVNDEPRSDIYSIGVLMYRMLIGEPPFTGNIHYVVLQHIRAEPTRPRRRRPTMPEEVETIILRAMAKRPDDRLASMTELREALEATPMGDAADGPATVETSRDRPSRTGIRWIATVLGIGAVAGLGWFVVVDDQEPVSVEASGAGLGLDEVEQPRSEGSTTGASSSGLGITTSDSGEGSSTTEGGLPSPLGTTGVDEPAPREPRSKRRPRTKKKRVGPRKDDEVIRGVRRTLVKKCKKGSTSYRVRGQILKTGEVLTVSVSPDGDATDCIERIVKGARFASGAALRMLPKIDIVL